MVFLLLFALSVYQLNIADNLEKRLSHMFATDHDMLVSL
jgi:hypothetical protein